MADQKAFDPVPTSLVIGKEVSRGSFGVVFFATLNKNPVAVKEFHEILMRNTSKNVHLQNFRKECEQLKELAHANVVKFIGAYQGAKGPLLVMELMHETLEVYLEREKGRLSRERVLEICFSVCEGMAYLHGLKNPLIHRDLSSKNVLLTETGVVKIADFGQSKLLGDLQDTLRTTQPGTIAYMPPEALKKKKTYTAKVDSFSLGVLLLEICIQNPPSTAWDGIGTIEEVKRREDDLRLLDDAHPLKPLIVWCLQYEELRPTVAGIHNHVNSVKASNKAIIDELKEKLVREQFQRVAEAANHSDQAKAFLRTIREVRIERDEIQARLAQLREVAVSNKREAEIFKNKFEHSKQMEQQLRARIEQLQKDNAKSSHDIANKNDRWFLKSNRRLSQSDDHGRLGGHRGGRHGDRHGGGHGKQDEDSEMTMAALLSEKTFWEDQCKQQKEDFEYEREHSRQLEQQLREENHKLKQEKAHVVKGAQTGVYREAHGHYGDQHGGEDDVDMIIATLKSENSHLEEQNKQLKKDYEYTQHQHQVLSQEYRHSHSTVEDLKVEIRELHDRLNQQAVSPRGPVDPHYPSERDIKVPPGYTNRGDLAERANYYPPDRRQPGHAPHLNPGSDSGYSNESRQHRDHHTPRSPFVHSPNYDGRRIKDTPINNTPTVDSESSTDLPTPMCMRHGVQQSLSSDSDTSFQPNQRYIGDRINREIKQQAKHYKVGVRKPTDDTPYSGTPTFGPELSAGLQPPMHSGTSFQPNLKYIGDGINREIEHEAKKYKEGMRKGLPVADEVDEELWPYDPNLVCPHCGKRFRHGQIREFRYHINDEHPTSLP